MTKFIANCSNCGTILLHGKNNSDVEVKCPKCRKIFNVVVYKGNVSVNQVAPTK